MKIERSRKVPRTNRVPDIGTVLVPERAEQRPAKVGEVVQVPFAVRQHLLIQITRNCKRHSPPSTKNTESVHRNEGEEARLNVDREVWWDDKRDLSVGETERGHSEECVDCSGRAQ